MYYAFLIIDYSIPFLMIISYPWWKKKANEEINQYSGFRTSKSMKNQENWEKANLLCARYYLYAGIILSIFVTIMRYIKVMPIQWNSLVITSISVIIMLLVIGLVNRKLK